MDVGGFFLMPIDEPPEHGLFFCRAAPALTLNANSWVIPLLMTTETKKELQELSGILGRMQQLVQLLKSDPEPEQFVILLRELSDLFDEAEGRLARARLRSTWEGHPCSMMAEHPIFFALGQRGAVPIPGLAESG